MDCRSEYYQKVFTLEDTVHAQKHRKSIEDEFKLGEKIEGKKGGSEKKTEWGAGRRNDRQWK